MSVFQCETVIPIEVPDIQLDFGAVADENEEDPGGFLCLNDDDDNGDGVPDKDETAPTTGEDDLVPLTITADGTLNGTLTLSVASSATRIKLYDNPDRSSPVTLPATWELGGLPKTFYVTLYVEGVNTSLAARDVELFLSFDGPGGICADIVNLTVYDFQLKEVSYSGGTYRKLRRDTDSMAYSAPHWQDNSAPLDGDADDATDRRYPVAFIRNSTMSAAVRVTIDPPVLLASSALVHGDGPGTIDFDGAATLDVTELTTGNMTAGALFENAVDYFDPMVIDWTVSLDGGQTWCVAGTSDSPVYVILAEPTLLPTERWHTLFRNSCRDADGATTDTQVLAGVWSDFTDQVVMRADDPVQLTYYDAWVCGNINTQSLLATGDGQCGAWAKLLLDMLRAHGINYLNEYVFLYHVDPTSGNFGFLVNDWTFAQGNGQSGDPAFPYLNIPPEFPNPLIVNNTYVWRFAEASDAPGVPGQGTVDPASLFNNHQVVKIAGVYFDPSYGEVYGSLGAIDSGAVAAHYKVVVDLEVSESAIGVDLNADGDTDDTVPVPAFLVDTNPLGNQLQESIGDYP
mgnify:CR=1 FL=1